jgi:hypothetical protein
MVSEWTPDLHRRAFRFWTEGHTFEKFTSEEHTIEFCGFAASLTRHPSSFPCMPTPGVDSRNESAPFHCGQLRSTRRIRKQLRPS